MFIKQQHAMFNGMFNSMFNSTFNSKFNGIFAAVLLLFTLGFSASSKADLIDVNVSNDAVMLHYLVDMGQGLHVGGGFLHEEDNGEVISIDLLVRDDLRSGVHAFSAGVGGKIMVVIPSGPGDDGATLTLGGFVNYQLPSLKALAVQGELYYGPSVTSNNVDGMGFYRLALELEVIERAKLHIGYRKVEVKYAGSREAMDEGINVGIKLEF